MQNLMRQFLTWIDYLVTCAVVFTLFWQTFITVLKKLPKKSPFLEFCNWSEQRLFEFSHPKITHNNIFWVIFKHCDLFKLEGRDDSRLFFKNKQCFHSEDDFFIMQKSKAFSTRLPKVPTKMAQSWPWKEAKLNNWHSMKFIARMTQSVYCFSSQKGDQVEINEPLKTKLIYGKWSQFIAND